MFESKTLYIGSLYHEKKIQPKFYVFANKIFLYLPKIFQTEEPEAQLVLNNCLYSMYHQQHNKWYLQMFLLAPFEATLYLSRTEFTFL